MAEKTSRFQQLRTRYEWLDHVVRAGGRYTERNGDYYAAAVTYFSVLSLVPLILVSFAVAGYVLFFNPELLQQLRQGISANLPSGLGALIDPVIKNAIDNRGTIGFIGLLGALYSGVGWMSNLRQALSEQWAQVPAAPALPKRLLFDLLTLLGLGVALVGSLAITTVANGLTKSVLELLGLVEQGWAVVLLAAVGVLLSLVANWLIFLWVIARLPREHTPLRSAAKAAVLGAVGFEVLKQVMTVYLKSVTDSPAGALLGPFIGLLVFVYFASRFVLFVTAWAATSRENEQPRAVPVPGPAVIRSEVVVHDGPSRGTTAGLLGAGALTGLLGGALLLGRRR